MYFTYKGKSSKDFNIKIFESNYLGFPKKNIEVIPIQGRNGSLLIDYGNFENFNLYFNCDIKNTDLDYISVELQKWLQTDIGYSDLVVYRNDVAVKTFSAAFISKLDLKEICKNYGEIKLDFECKPFKVVSE